MFSKRIYYCFVLFRLSVFFGDLDLFLIAELNLGDFFIICEDTEVLCLVGTVKDIGLSVIISSIILSYNNSTF